MESQQLVLGIQKETVSVWERRVPLTPEDVKKLVKEHNIKVVVQPSSNRAFNDWSYEQAGALISDDLSEAQVILGIKPVKPNELLPNKTYIKYSRIHTGSEQIVPYLKHLLQHKVCLIDYEKIKDEKDNMLIGSSKLAGVVGIYNIFRLLGEFCLIRMNLNTPFLFSGGSAYMH